MQLLLDGSVLPNVNASDQAYANEIYNDLFYYGFSIHCERKKLLGHWNFQYHLYHLGVR